MSYDYTELHEIVRFLTSNKFEIPRWKNEEIHLYTWYGVSSRDVELDEYKGNTQKSPLW